VCSTRSNKATNGRANPYLCSPLHFAVTMDREVQQLMEMVGRGSVSLAHCELTG
jgi:hypothetical protein